MKLYIAFLTMLVVSIAACSKAKPCGTFNFDGHHFVSDHGDELPGVEATLTFDFDPGLCGSSNCQCDQIVFIQLARILDVPNQKFITLFPEQDARMVKTGKEAGWWVDRAPGPSHGFFKQNEDGTFGADITIGSNTQLAILKDVPINQKGKWQYWEFVDVPVCIAGGCVNKVLGFHHWSFTIDKNGKVTDAAIAHGGSTDYFDELTAAVAAWNNAATAQGKIPLPALSQLRDP